MNRRSLLALGLLAACSTGAQVRQDDRSRDPAGSAQLNRYQIEVLVPAEGGSGWNLLANGGGLRSGARYSLRLSVSEPLFLYVEQRSGSGTQWRWPAEGMPATAQPKEQPLLIPKSDFLTLDQQRGTEWIFVVASRTQPTEAEIRGELDRQAAEAGRDGAQESNSRNRGEPVRGGLDSRGIGAIRFRIQHE